MEGQPRLVIGVVVVVGGEAMGWKRWVGGSRAKIRVKISQGHAGEGEGHRRPDERLHQRLVSQRLALRCGHPREAPTQLDGLRAGGGRGGGGGGPHDEVSAERVPAGRRECAAGAEGAEGSGRGGRDSAPHRPASSAPPPPRTRPLAATASRPLLLPSASLRGISRHSAKVRCRGSVADDGEAPAPGASEVSLWRHSVTASPWGSATVTPAAVRAKQAPGPSRWS